jgi:hypothetical protein
MEQLLHQVEFYESPAPPQHYGDEATLYVAAWILHQRVVVINTFNDTTSVILPDATPSGNQEIVVLYNGTDHYDGTAPTRAPRDGHRDEAGRPPISNRKRPTTQR